MENKHGLQTDNDNDDKYKSKRYLHVTLANMMLIDI